MFHCSPPFAHYTLSRFTKPHTIYRFFSRFITHFIFKYLCTSFYTCSLFKCKNMQEFKIIYSCHYLFSPRSYFSTFCFVDRSEEHTSELQSRFDVVCHLLLRQKQRNRRARLLL